MWNAAGRGSTGPETAVTEAWRWDGLGGAEGWSRGWYGEQGKDGGWYPEWEGRTLQTITRFSMGLRNVSSFPWIGSGCKVFQRSQTWEVMLYASFYQTQAPALSKRTAGGREGNVQACADPAFRSVVSLTFKTHGMAPHSSTFAWKIPWTEEPCRLQSMGSRRVRHD